MDKVVVVELEVVGMIVFIIESLVDLDVELMEELVLFVEIYSVVFFE